MLCTFRNIQLQWPQADCWQYDVFGQGISELVTCFSVDNGDVIWLRGENGVGKSTWMRSICGLLPTSGEIEWHFAHSGRLSTAQLFRPSVPCLDQCISAADLIGQEYLFRTQSVINVEQMQDYLLYFDLLSVQHLPVHTLSTGQCSRLSLVPLLYTKQKVWLLDEPFAHLDSSGRDLVYSLLESHRSAGGAAIVSSHQPLAANVKTVELIRVGG